MRKLLIMFIFSLLLISCDKSRITEETKDINGYWRADSAVNFNFIITEPNTDYNVLLSLRNGVEYPHSNIYFKYALKDSVGVAIESELINFNIFNPKTGYPLGNGVGDIFEHEYELLTKYRFETAGQYQISFQQYMRYDSLPEIYSIGFRVEKTSAD